MNQENDNKLVQAFPRLYRDRYGSKMETCMCWGFACGDGWFNLIWNLSEKLETEISKLTDVKEDELPRAVQVKEKFGTLRFYMTYETTAMEKAIREAEDLSEETCETCGQPGRIHSEAGWWRTACDACNSKYMEKRK